MPFEEQMICLYSENAHKPEGNEMAVFTFEINPALQMGSESELAVWKYMIETDGLLMKVPYSLEAKHKNHAEWQTVSGSIYIVNVEDFVKQFNSEIAHALPTAGTPRLNIVKDEKKIRLRMNNYAVRNLSNNIQQICGLVQGSDYAAGRDLRGHHEPALPETVSLLVDIDCVGYTSAIVPAKSGVLQQPQAILAMDLKKGAGGGVTTGTIARPHWVKMGKTSISRVTICLRYATGGTVQYLNWQNQMALHLLLHKERQ